MRKLRTLFAATAFSGLVAATAFMPAAYAQVTDPNTSVTPPVVEVSARGSHGGFGRLTCNADAASQLQTRLDGVAAQLALTPEQAPLFDAYKTAALTAQTSFADACGQIQAGDNGTAQDLLTHMRTRQALASAELDGLNATLPSFEAFYNSLNDQQKAQLAAQNGHGNGRGHDREGFNQRRGHDRDDFNQGRGHGGRGMDRMSMNGFDHRDETFAPPVQQQVPSTSPTTLPSITVPAPTTPIV